MTNITRRDLLARSALIGCCAAASPLLTPMSFASAPGDNRLVVLILRGGMDGLDMLRPVGDAHYAKLRPTLGVKRGPALDGFYELHPDLAGLMPLWAAGELAFAQAVSTPYRDKRSHFDGQDLLEAGTESLQGGGVRDGWLNRMLQVMPGVHGETAYAIGREEMRLVNGAAEVAKWWPGLDVTLSSQGVRLLNLTMAEDPAMAAAMGQALSLANSDGDGVVLEGDGAGMVDAVMSDMRAASSGQSHLRMAEFAADKLLGSARIATFSLNGWDTHNRQSRNIGRSFGRLGDTLMTLRDGLGADVWGRTTVLALTEFGRTVAENGTRGTDHGTGGTMLMAGGALRGGQVFGAFPGLAEVDLYDRRDLMPGSDIREWAAWALRESFGLAKSDLVGTVFPGLEMGVTPKLLR